MKLSENPLYTLAFQSNVDPDWRIYMPAENTALHKSREMAAHAQNIYSDAGGTKDLYRHVFNDFIRRCNDEKDIKTLRTDIATISQGMLYRTEYPIDEDCAIRMGAVLSFLEDENPNECHASITERKVKFAKEKDPALYDFFLNAGISLTPAYLELSAHLNDSEYFQKRNETLRALSVQ